MPNTLPIVLQKIVFKSFIIILTLSRATLDFSGLVWCLGLNLPQVFATSATCFRALNIYIHTTSEDEFKEFEPRHWIFFQIGCVFAKYDLFKPTISIQNCIYMNFRIKELSLCNKVEFSNSYIFATEWCTPMIFQI